jgi:hypothetical protein
LISVSLRKLTPSCLHRSLTVGEQHEPLNSGQIFIQYLRANFSLHDFQSNGVGLPVKRLHTFYWYGNLISMLKYDVFTVLYGLLLKSLKYILTQATKENTVVFIVFPNVLTTAGNQDTSIYIIYQRALCPQIMSHI